MKSFVGKFALAMAVVIGATGCATAGSVGNPCADSAIVDGVKGAALGAAVGALAGLIIGAGGGAAKGASLGAIVVGTGGAIKGYSDCDKIGGHDRNHPRNPSHQSGPYPPQPPQQNRDYEAPIPRGAVMLPGAVANTLQGRTTYVNGAQNEVRGIIEDSVRVAGGLIAVGGNADFNIHVETREYNRNTPWIQGGSFGNTQAVVLEVRIIRRADNVLIFRGSDERSFDQQYGQYARERATIDAVREALANLY